METNSSAEAVGRRIRILREAKGWPGQGPFAALLDVSQSRLSNWETQGFMIPPDMAVKLCSLTGATTDYIYRGDLSGLSASLIQAIKAREEDLARKPA